MNKTITIEFPEFLANSLRLKKKDFQSEMKVSSLVKLFEIGRVSSGTAARVLGISRVEFLELLAKYNVSVFGHYDKNDITDDIANA
jgi:predicted HTH domain antitoxin